MHRISVQNKNHVKQHQKLFFQTAAGAYDTGDESDNHHKWG
jgi:hypothetical protein